MLENADKIYDNTSIAKLQVFADRWGTQRDTLVATMRIVVQGKNCPVELFEKILGYAVQRIVFLDKRTQTGS